MIAFNSIYLRKHTQFLIIGFNSEWDYGKQVCIILNNEYVWSHAVKITYAYHVKLRWKVGI